MFVILLPLDMSILPSFCSLTSKSNNCTPAVACYTNKASTLPDLMVFNFETSPINISCCCLAFKNIRNTLRFALSRLNTSGALYLTGFNIKIHHAYILCCILTLKYFTGTFLFTFYFISAFFLSYLLFLTVKCNQRRIFVGLRPRKHKL